MQGQVADNDSQCDALSPFTDDILLHFVTHLYFYYITTVKFEHIPVFELVLRSVTVFLLNWVYFLSIEKNNWSLLRVKCQ